MPLGIEAKIKNWVDEKLSEEGWEDAFLIDIVAHSNKLEIFIDADLGISFGRCKRMSRHLEAYLDEMNYKDGKYGIVVSSPGVDRPIKLRRQFEKNVGRNLKITLKDGSEEVGLFNKMEGDQLTLEMPHPEKKKTMIEKEINFNDLERAIVQISFKKKKK